MISSQETESSLSKNTSSPKAQKPKSPRTKPNKSTTKTPVEDQHTQPKPMKKATKQPKATSSTQRKKSNSPKKSKSSRSQSPSSDVPQLSYASTSGTDSDDSEHLDTQLSHQMYSMDINSSSRQNVKQSQRVAIAKHDEVKYAGPTFSNAPAPDMLPLPGFNNHHVGAPSQIELQRRSRDLFNLLQPQAPLNNVYTAHAQVDKPMSLQDIEQGLRTFLKIQA